MYHFISHALSKPSTIGMHCFVCSYYRLPLPLPFPLPFPPLNPLALLPVTDDTLPFLSFNGTLSPFLDLVPSRLPPPPPPPPALTPNSLSNPTLPVFRFPQLA